MYSPSGDAARVPFDRAPPPRGTGSCYRARHHPTGRGSTVSGLVQIFLAKFTSRRMNTVAPSRTDSAVAGGVLSLAVIEIPCRATGNTTIRLLTASRSVAPRGSAAETSKAEFCVLMQRKIDGPTVS